VSRRREQLVATAAAEVGLAPTTTLSALADVASDEDERRVLGDRRQVMRAQVARINSLCAKNREILARNLAATTDALAMLGDSPTYTAAAKTKVSAPHSRMLDAKA
jgi:flagellar biosynthesis/type III secretory pathway chaperone